MRAVRKGTYVLFLRFGHPYEGDVGMLGHVSLPAGCYCYVGSAMSGLDQRLDRHLRKEKTIRWHIDRLTIACDSSEAYISWPEYVPECRLAAMAEECGCIPVVPGFGCSDCHCATHLFFAGDVQRRRLVEMAELEPFC